MSEIITNVNPNIMNLRAVVGKAEQYVSLFNSVNREGWSEEEIAVVALCKSLTDSVGGGKGFVGHPEEKAWFDYLTESAVFQNLVFKAVGDGKKGKELNG